MGSLQKIECLNREETKHIVSTCLCHAVPNPDEVVEELLLGTMALCLSSSGFWLFSKLDRTFRIEAVQGVGLVNNFFRKNLEHVARENDCDTLWCQSRNWNVVHLLIRLGFRIIGVNDSHIVLTKGITE